jgi:hypothetical protein
MNIRFVFEVSSPPHLPPPPNGEGKLPRAKSPAPVWRRVGGAQRSLADA